VSRIRSVHPGLWTDEAFVTLSAHSRLFFMGLWTECDDNGSFEWAPLKLKMRLAPADAVDGAALLAEIEAAGCIMTYEEGGKRYGAVRNFCQYQRPKKPNSVHPQTEAVRAWVNTDARITRDGTEAVGKQSPTGGEKSRQMEDGGGSGSSVAKATGAEAPLQPDPDTAFWSAAKSYLGPKNAGMIGKWVKEHGREATAAAISAAQVARAVEPKSFIQGRFRLLSREAAEGPIC
jgi:hypothetical protein